MRNSEISWLVSGFNYIDYDKESFIKESFLVMYYTKGGMNYETLFKMPFDDFLLYVKEATRIQTEFNKEDTNG